MINATQLKSKIQFWAEMLSPKMTPDPKRMVALLRGGQVEKVRRKKKEENAQKDGRKEAKKKRCKSRH